MKFTIEIPDNLIGEFIGYLETSPDIIRANAYLPFSQEEIALIETVIPMITNQIKQQKTGS